MAITPDLYPPPPDPVPEALTQTSPSFRRQAIGVLLVIGLFFLVYFLLMVLALALAAGTVYGGLALIVSMPGGLTIMLGIGLIGLGVMVLFFLIKFLFAKTRHDLSSSVELKENDQPRLFAYIRRLSRETRTAFPRRIYLSPEVNASVFYNSGFWSMILPVKKNLQIGLGLVNSINNSEFKAVLAHEFGHFSQRSMKLGSFVYQVNRVIYNLLFENSGYAQSLENWGRMSGYFSIFAGITAYIVRGIQYVLRHMYGLINRQYMSLSREMEFHADAVAASVAGSANLISALRRIGMADAAFQVAVSKCGEWYKQNFVSSNIYPNQHAVAVLLAKDHRLPLQNGLPDVAEGMPSIRKSRVVYKDQWASHPSLEEREEQLRRLNVEVQVFDQPAWVLFDNAEIWQERLTRKIYGDLLIDEKATPQDACAFKQRLEAELERFDFPAEYQGYYDGREISAFDVTRIPERAGRYSEKPVPVPCRSFFSDQHLDLPKSIRGIEADLSILRGIEAREIGTKYFEIDGRKYNYRQAGREAARLENERKLFQQQLDDNDVQLVTMIYAAAVRVSQQQATDLLERYAQYFQWRSRAEGYLELIQRIMRGLQPLYAGATVSLSEVNAMLATLKETHEGLLKSDLKFWTNAGAFAADPVFMESLQRYLQSNYAYFSGESFFEHELIHLDQVMKQSYQLVQAHLRIAFRQILVIQLPYLENQ